MGNYISQNSVYLSVRRFLTLYNVENRAAKELARQQEKPKAAPKYDAGHIDYHKLMKESPSYVARTTKINTDLDKRLKDVYVTSTDPEIVERAPQNESRPLPLSRTTDYFELGYKDPDVVTPGRVTLIQAMNFLAAHKTNPVEHTIARIAEENKIKLEYADDIVKHFRVFNIHFSDEKDRKLLTPEAQKQLTGGVSQK